MKGLFLIIFLFFAITALQSQDRSQNFTHNQFLLGEKLKTENEEYYLLLDVAAKTNEQMQAQPLQAGETMLMKKNVFHIYQTSVTQTQSRTQAAQQSASTYQNSSSNTGVMVAWNKRTKNFGIVTGAIIIELKDFADADSLVRDYHLTETHRFGGFSKLVIAKTSFDGFSTTLSEIKQDHRVQEAQAEVLEHFQVAQ